MGRCNISLSAQKTLEDPTKQSHESTSTHNRGTRQRGNERALNFSCDVITYGAAPAVFNATFDANGTVVFSFTDVYLESRGMTVLGFVWNTSGADVGSYTVIVRVSALENESELDDNTRSVWMLVSSLVGDINGNGKVDMKDIGYTARGFMCIPGDLLWDPVADLNNDGRINMNDIGTVARHFGEHYP